MPPKIRPSKRGCGGADQPLRRSMRPIAGVRTTLTIVAQMQTLLQSVSLPLEEIEVMEKQINEWESESISSRGEVAHNLKAKLRETQERLDRLVSLYLDGDIERNLYLAKKDAPLRQKAKLEESLGDFWATGKESALTPLSRTKCFQSIGANSGILRRKQKRILPCGAVNSDKVSVVHGGGLEKRVALCYK